MNILVAIIMAFSIHPIHKTSLFNCEDRDVVPCYTYDEGRWRVVKSYRPYRAVNTRLCSSWKAYNCLMAEKNGKRVYVA